MRLHFDESRHEGGAVSVGSCGPFGDGDDFDVDAAYDAMCIECDALRVENRLLISGSRLKLRSGRRQSPGC